MAYLGEKFDPSAVEQDERNYDPLPPGDYVCQIVDSTIADTKSGGEMLKLTLEVIEGAKAGAKIFDNLNIRNSNPTAQKIAHQTLKSIADAVDAGAFEDSEVLHYRPLIATLKIEPARTVGDRTYDARNAVKKYKPRSGASLSAPPAAARRESAPAPIAAAATKRPWGNGAARAQAGDPPF